MVWSMTGNTTKCKTKEHQTIPGLLIVVPILKKTLAEIDDGSETVLETQDDYEAYVRKTLGSVYIPTYDTNVHKAPSFKSDQVLLIKQRFEKQAGRGQEMEMCRHPIPLEMLTQTLSVPRPKRTLRFGVEFSVVTAEDVSQNASTSQPGRDIGRIMMAGSMMESGFLEGGRLQNSLFPYHKKQMKVMPERHSNEILSTTKQSVCQYKSKHLQHLLSLFQQLQTVGQTH